MLICGTGIRWTEIGPTLICGTGIRWTERCRRGRERSVGTEIRLVTSAATRVVAVGVVRDAAGFGEPVDELNA